MKSTISIREAFNYFWKSPDKWKRVAGLGGIYLGIMGIYVLISLASVIPIIGVIISCILYPLLFVVNFAYQFFMFGHYMEIFQNVRAGKDELPEVIGDYKARMKKGLMYYLIALIYSLPVSLIMTVMIFVLMFGYIAVAGTSDEPSTAASIVFALLVGLTFLIIVVVSAILGIFMHAAIYRYLVFNDLGRAFDFKQVYQIAKTGLSDYIKLFIKSFIAGLIYMVAVLIVFSPFLLISVIGGAVGENSPLQMIFLILACGLVVVAILLMVVIVVAYAFYMAPHLMGQLYRAWDKRKLDKI